MENEAGRAAGREKRAEPDDADMAAECAEICMEAAEVEQKMIGERVGDYAIISARDASDEPEKVIDCIREFFAMQRKTEGKLVKGTTEIHVKTTELEKWVAVRIEWRRITDDMGAGTDAERDAAGIPGD
jgi:hypothetical protein